MTARNVLLFSHTSMGDLANKIESLASSISFSGAQSQIKLLNLQNVQWNHFPDGFPNLFVNIVEECCGKDIVFLGSFHSPAVIFEQVSLIYSLPRFNIRSLTFVLPYFPTGTMERVDTEGQIATAKTLARILSSIPFTACGPAKLLIFDIHALQERFYFSDNVLPLLCSAVPRLVHQLENFRANGIESTIAFPDEGAHKRFHNFFTSFPVIRCIKKRIGQRREVTIVDGDPKNKHIVIVDDLIMTGGTMMKCVDSMLNAGASSVSAYVTHAVFPNNSWKKFIPNDTAPTDQKNLKFFWITDSVPHANEIAEHKPFNLLTLADSIHTELHRTVFI